MNIGEYCPEKNIILHELASANNILRETIFTNIYAITLLLYSKCLKTSNSYIFITDDVNFSVHICTSAIW